MWCIDNLEKNKYEGAVYFFDYNPPRSSRFIYNIDEKYKDYKVGALKVNWTFGNKSLILIQSVDTTSCKINCFENEGQTYRAMNISKRNGENFITFEALEDPLDFFIIDFFLYR